MRGLVRWASERTSFQPAGARIDPDAATLIAAIITSPALTRLGRDSASERLPPCPTDADRNLIVARATAGRASAAVNRRTSFARLPFLPGTRLTLALNANLPRALDGAAVPAGVGSAVVPTPAIGTYGTPWRAERWTSAGPAVAGQRVPPSPVYLR